MTMNKTPSSHSGYFTELTASAGKQSNFIFPVRIKVTPNTSVRPLSDGKKNSTKMMQPVLIKDLFPSSQKDRSNSILTSVSTQKKKARSQRLNQPYLNTQSCYKPKKEVEESTLFGIQTSGGSKVRRQLYQTLDSPQKFAESKENINKLSKPKKLPIKNLDDTFSKNTSMESKAKKSFLLPPNTIKNTFIRKSGSNFTTAKQTVKTAPTVNKNTRATLQNTEPKKQQIRPKNNTEVRSAKNNISSNPTDNKRKSTVVRNNLTSSHYNRKSVASKVSTNLGTIPRPTVIMSPNLKKSSKHLNNSDYICTEMQNLSVNGAPCMQGIQSFNATQQTIDLDFSKISCTDQNGLMQLKSYLEQSLQASENHVRQLKKAIDCINAITEKSKTEAETNATLNNQVEVNTEAAEKCNLSYTIAINEEHSSTLLINKSSSLEDDTSTEKIIVPNDINVSLAEEKVEAKTEVNVEEKLEEDKVDVNMEQTLPIPIKILVNDADLQESTEAAVDTPNNVTRLSTIGEVSCELSSDINDWKKSEKDSCEKNYKSNLSTTKEIDVGESSENKENVNDTVNKVPRTPRTRRQSSNVEIPTSQRRRSARLASKSMSESVLSDSEKQDSFTLLENELNVVHNPVPSKSLPASPTKIPMTPATTKRYERPLKEYMALKMNGTFLVTPDVKRFQSCLEPTETPHSRKSLSRKIFMELCDLYGESPEHH